MTVQVNPLGEYIFRLNFANTCLSEVCQHNNFLDRAWWGLSLASMCLKYSLKCGHQGEITVVAMKIAIGTLSS